tara:strand:+ start:1204 stop:7038 length:5835 start_codon:yes stop_codon:yes gene_type:complete
MGLSRLDNFLKNARGNILYVNPNDLDSTDSIENQGNSLTRPFKSLQRALIEAARFSYQRGLNNDRFGQTTILLYPGDYPIDNRPGWIPDGVGNFKLRNGSSSSNFSPWDLTTNYDLTVADNALYKMNSVHGGVIVPRGTSIVGMDLRKTKIRPLYVPSPTNDNIDRSAIFRVTGGCYFWQFSFFDGDPNGQVYVDYTDTKFIPNTSHHKLTCFEYADGTNNVSIADAFMTYSTERTDLEMYYEKVGLAYGQASGRSVEPDYPSSGLDIQPKIDEHRIVGSTGLTVGITSIRSHDGSSTTVSTTDITLTTDAEVAGLDVDTPFRVEGVTVAGYNGQYVVSEKVSSTQIKYQVQNPPLEPSPAATGSQLSLQSDTVTSASPYIFNISMRSVFGMNGLHADGSKATGFKSMVVAQFTGIGIQKDDSAFVLYDTTTGEWKDSTTPGNETLSNNSRAVFKPEYSNYHIKCSNNGFIQNVSIFAIGFANQFLCESGGDMSITNSNSNFGSKALVSKGFRKDAFAQDDIGYITHILPPKEIENENVNIEFNSIDVPKTISVANNERLYLYNEVNSDVPPTTIIDGYRFGAKTGDTLDVLISVGGTITKYSGSIYMDGSSDTSKKIFRVNQSAAGINSVTDNVIELTGAHTLSNGESIRILSENGSLPDGLIPNRIYYAITSTSFSGITTNTQLKVAKTLNDAIAGEAAPINEKGGSIKIESRVSDKNAGDLGHPLQYDSTESQWYVNVGSDNTIYPTIVGLGTTSLGDATPRTFFARTPDTRNTNDTVYRARYVIPANTGGTVARPPQEGFILQESNASIGSTTGEIQTYLGTGSINNVNQLRNLRLISDVSWSGGKVYVTTEIPHNVEVGQEVELRNVKSTANTAGTQNVGYNKLWTITEVPHSKQFVFETSSDSGTFTNDTTQRTTDLPYFKKKRFKDTYVVYRVEEAKQYIAGRQDGIYYLTFLNSNNNPTVAPFTTSRYLQSVQQFFPQSNKDNPSSDPEEAKSFAVSDIIGNVVVNDVEKSVTKETFRKLVGDTKLGIGITDIISYDPGLVGSGQTHTLRTSVDHGLNRVTRVSIADSGSGYGSGVAGNIYNATLTGLAGSTTGQYATAKITVDSAGGITDIKIMDGGSAYAEGNTLAITGISTFAPYSQATVTVSKIYDNINDVIEVAGITSESNSKFNRLYKISEIPVGSARSVTVYSYDNITGVTTTGLDASFMSGATANVTGPALTISSLDYNNVSGIATVVTTSRHGLSVDSKVRINSSTTLFNGEFIVKRKIDLTSFSIGIGKSVSATSLSGTAEVFRPGNNSRGGIVNADNESLAGRMLHSYAGITTTLGSAISTPTAENISLTNVGNLDINIGDYLMIDDEIVRVKTNVPSAPTNPLTVFRGVLGTRAKTHSTNSVVTRVNILPVELRRHSIMRASGHTFEYVGFGPGNYSTAFPDKHDRSISADEELLAQSTREDGGINFYTGMNDRGISYAGNKKLSTVTGQEEIFDTPVRTVTGEDIGVLPNINVITPLEGIFSRSVRVEGGLDNTVSSEFNGPVIFSNKITSTSEKGIEGASFFIQGDATVSRKYTVGIATPVLSGTPGDIVYFDNPSAGGYIGWVYTSDQDWYRFGNVSLSKDLNIALFDQVGIATTSPGTNRLQVGSGSNLFAVDTNGVGIGTSANLYKLNVRGNSNVSGTLYAGYFAGDGSGITNLNAAALGWTQVTNGLYNSALSRVGLGTTNPRFMTEIGPVGTADTTLHVNGYANFVGVLSATNMRVSGMLTANAFDFSSTSGQINAGVGTFTKIVVGTAISTFGSDVGMGTATPRAKLDVEGSARFRSYSEGVEILDIDSGVVTVDLSKANNFTLEVDAVVEKFEILNCPSDATSWMIKIDQNSTGGYSVGITTFVDSGANAIDLYWPGGGVLPGVTTEASRTDIYSFKTFDGGSNWYGFVGGQNFL